MSNKNNIFFSKYYLYLAFFYFLSIITTTVSANYFFKMGPFSMAGGIFIFPFSFLIGAIIGEVYNYSYQRIVVILSVLCQLVFVVYVHFIVTFPPASFFYGQSQYQAVFSSDLRYAIFAIIGLYFSELINVYLLTKWKCKSPGVGFIVRAFLCIAVSQLGLSVVVNIGAFLGETGGLAGLIHLGVSNYVMKMLATMIFIVPSYVFVVYLKKREGVTYLDVNTKFKPFSTKVDNVYLVKKSYG